MSPFDVFNFLTPDTNSTPEQVNSWRNKVAFSITLIAMVCIGSPLLLEKRYAKAEDLDKVHSEIRGEVAQVKEQLNQVNKSLTDLTRARQADSIVNLREKLNDLQTRLCRTPPSDFRNALLLQLQDLRSQYMALVGNEYPIFTCKDLLGN